MESKKGSDADLYLATSPNLKNVRDDFFEGGQKSGANAQAYDTETRRRLREFEQETRQSVRVGHITTGHGPI